MLWLLDYEREVRVMHGSGYPACRSWAVSCALGDLLDKQGLHSCNNAYLHRAGPFTVLGYAAWGEKERIRPNVYSVRVKFSANRNSRSLQYLEKFGARIAMVSLILTTGRRHSSGIWFTLQLCPTPGCLSLGTALLLHDGGC